MKSLSLLLSLIISILFSSLYALPTGPSQAIEVLQDSLWAVNEASTGAVKTAASNSNGMVESLVNRVESSPIRWTIEDFANKKFMAASRIGYFDMSRFNMPPIKMKTELGGRLLMENQKRQWIPVPPQVLYDPHEGFLPQFFLIKYTE